jgi:hypothetical protein
LAIVTKPSLSPVFATPAFPAKNPDMQTGSLQPGGASVPASNATLDQRQEITRAEPPKSSLNSALQGAAVRQSGLAPLIADLVEAQRMPGVPAFVETALLEVLAMRRPLDVAPTGWDIKTALIRSGLFSEARPPAGARATPAVAPALSAQPDMGKALIALQQVLKTWLADPTAKSGVPTDANAGAPSASRPPANYPPPALVAGGPTRIAQEPSIAGATTAAPVTNSNMAAQSQTASAHSAQPPSVSPAAPAAAANPQATATPQAGSTPNAQPPSISGAATAAPVTNSNTAAQSQTGSAQSAPPPSVSPAVPAAPAASPQATATPQTVSMPNAPPPSISVAGMAAAMADPVTAAKPQSGFLQPNLIASPLESMQTPNSVTASAAATELRPAAAFAGAAKSDTALPVLPLQQALKLSSALAPQAYERVAARDSVLEPSPSGASPVQPPPYRGGPTSAQPPLPPSFTSDADPHLAAQVLLTRTEGALSHIQLLRNASQPDQPQANPRTEAAGLRWMFEIPFVTPQGTAVAQFEISRDDAGAGEHSSPAWRARFSLDVEPMGPVHAQAVLLGEHVWVTVWAEREASVQTLRSKEALLSQALRDSAFVPELAFCVGAPRAPAAAAGQFLDSAS